ncbi:SOCS box protein [Halocaridina rubra]|uniref:SOCS box protein n=1 Tax=Halocaridina rubra TaxID=373956 RepID=A0AAN8XAD5_HALRR
MVLNSGVAKMLTCPNCHHVLAAPSCCGITTPPTAQHLCPPSPHTTPHPQLSRHLHPSSAIAASSSASCLTSSACGGTSNGSNSSSGSSSLGPHVGTSLGPVPLNVNAQIQPQPLATPHISGHMFHFPTSHVHAVSACQSACHVTCHAAVHSPCMGSCHSACTAAATTNPWHWPDSAGHVVGHPTTRMHTSGGGIVDDSLSAKVIPPDIARRLNGVRDWTVWDDERVLGNMKKVLAESGWYWERLSWRQAETLLQSTSLGTFIVRESADTRFLYSLSVQTERGPTSVRIHYTTGKFRLDCESYMTSSIPEFSSIITLIEYYIRVSQKLQRHVWVDTQGKMYSPITIKQPLMRSVPTLKHLSRLAINLSFPRSFISVRLPPALSQYIDEYPYWC